MGRHDLTAGELSRMLAERAADIAGRLLPGGKRRGPEWKCGNTSGEKGQSLSVCLDGEKAGRWSDFATGEGGDLLDLIMAVRRCDLFEACREAKAWLGINDTAPIRAPRRKFTRPKRPVCHSPKTIVRDYLHGRGLSDATLKAYRIGEHGSRIVFPFLRDGELVMAKTREAKDGVSPKPTEANCEPCLFGWQVVSNTARDLILTEGEIDAMSVYEMGFPALSLPYGGGGGNKQQWIESEYERLSLFDQIYLMLDADETGEQAIAEIVKRLGEERLRIIRIPKPHKDANDLLRAGYGEQELAKLLLHAEHFDPVELIAPSALRDKVMGAGSTNLAPGVDLPWPKTHGDFRMRFGETVIVAGTNGHGKTEFMGNIAAGALSQGARVCAASYEFLPDRYLTRFVRQMVGVEEPTERAKDETLDYLDKRFWLVNARGRDRAKRTIEVFRYAAKRYGVRFFFIDNLSKCGIADDDYQGQKEFTDEVSEFAREMDVIVVLVMHMTKGDESRPATKMQARGSGQITDLADSLLIVWRNKMKEKALQLDGDDKKAREPDCKVICEKQRNGESEPMWALWFDSASHQFIESPQMFPRRYGRAAA